MRFRRSSLMLLVGFALLSLLLVTFQVVQASVIVVTDSIPAQKTNWTDTLSLPKFDAANGALGSIIMTVTGSVSGTLGYESLDEAPSTVLLELLTDLSVQTPDNEVLTVVLPKDALTTTASAFDGNDDFGGTSGGVQTLSNTASVSIVITEPSRLAKFVGSGDINLTGIATGTSRASGPGNIVLDLRVQSAALVIAVQYTYDPVINPAIHLEKTVYAGHNGGASCEGKELVIGDVGDPVTYCFVVTNTGDTYLDSIDLSDPDLGISMTAFSLIRGTTPLEPQASLVYYYHGTLDKPLFNTATVVANPTNENGNDIPNLPNVNDSDTAAVDVRGRVGDYVWVDGNLNGMQDSSELGLNGVTVLLLDGDGQPTGKTMVTGNHPDSGKPGWYQFDNLVAGSYQIEFVNPDINKYAFTNRNTNDSQANLDQRDSDANSVTGRTGVFTLGVGETNLTFDAGLVIPVPTASEESTEPDVPRNQYALFIPMIAR